MRYAEISDCGSAKAALASSMNPTIAIDLFIVLPTLDTGAPSRRFMAMMRWSDQLPRMMSPGLLLILASCDCKYRRRARTDWLPFARAEASQRPWLRGSPVGSCPARKTSSCSTGVCGRSPSEMDTNASKGLGPSTCAVEDAQNLDRVANQPVWHDERRPRDSPAVR